MKKWVKTLLYIIGVVIFGVLIYYMIPFTQLLMTEEGRNLINDKISSYGAFAPLVFILVEILQIIAAFIPGAPIEVMSGVLFGKFWGIIWCDVGVFLGTVIVFYLVRTFGRPLVFKLFPKEKLDTVKILNDEKKLTLTIFILFIIPGTPKDFLTYIAGLTKIKPLKFFLIATIARTPPMICSVLVGANLGQGAYKTSLIFFGIIIVLAAAGYFLKNKYFEKKEISFSKSNKSEKKD